MRTLRSRVFQHGILAVAMTLAAGCGIQTADSQLNTDTLQQRLTVRIHQQTGVVVRVNCPEDVPLRRGGIFECTATAGDGSTSRVAVVQDDDEGSVSWELKSETG
ncbi:MAG: DUF4333 domain-containing protein [Egibacteraceae bacterium]